MLNARFRLGITIAAILIAMGCGRSRSSANDTGARREAPVCSAASALLLHGAFRRAGDLAETCADHATAARAWYANGEFEHASDALLLAEREHTPNHATLFEVRVHVLAGRFAVAAAALRRIDPQAVRRPD